MVRAFTLLALLILLPAAAVAQRQDVRVADPPSARQAMDSSTAARFQLATEYLRGGQFDRAIPLLEDLYQKQPDNGVFSDKLREAYENIKRYQAAIDLIDDLLQQGSQDGPTLRADQARLYHLAGQSEQATVLWDSVLKSSNGAESIYRLVYNSLIRVRLLDRAIEVLLRGRAENVHGILFQPELAHLYGLTGQHEKAMQEYLGLLDASSRQINYVRGRLSRSLEQDGALAAALRVTEQHVATFPDRAVTRDLLSWLYMEAGNYQDAYAHVLTMDELNGGGGHAIYQFAQRAAEAGAFDVARRAYESVRYIHVDALLGIGRMHELQGEAEPMSESMPHFSAALDTYESLLTTHPNHPQRAKVMMRIAHLHHHIFRDAEAAWAILRSVAVDFAHQTVSQNARLELGRLALERGDLAEARNIFSLLSAADPAGEYTEQARLEVALMHFYSGDFSQAEQILAALSEETHEDVANNALTLRLLLLENPAQDSAAAALRTFADASLLLRQRKEDQVIARTEYMLTRWGQHPIADDTRLLRARAFRQADMVHEALAAFGELSLTHPDSPHADRSLFNYAEILERDLGDLASASDAYTDLLTRYPGSLFVNEARERIRTLRSAGV